MGKSSSSYPNLIWVAALMAAGAHASFLIMFLAAGVPLLAVVNVASSLLYLLIAVQMRRQRWRRICEALMAVEVPLHAVLAVWWLGWDSGFQYYLLLMLPVLMVSVLLSRGLKLLCALACMGLYLGLDVLTHRQAPLYTLSTDWLTGMRLFNAASTMGILTALSAVYYQLVLSAEAGLREMASLDPLTGLLNRRSLSDLARRHVDRLAEGEGVGHALSVLLGDVDHFKAVNDQHGHDVGDQVLRAVSLALQAGMRQGDLLGRWGGEEFLVLLPGTEASAARMVAERLRALVQARSLRVPGSAALLPVSISFGICQVRPGEPLDKAIARADRALYRAKRAGRNRVVVADERVQAEPAGE